VERGPLGVERCLDDATPGLGEADANHAPIGRRPKRPHESSGVQLVDHQRDPRFRRLDELGKIALHASLGSGGPGLEKEVVLERAEVVLRERSIDLNHGLAEPAAEDCSKPQVVDRGVLEEVAVARLGVCLCR